MHPFVRSYLDAWNRNDARAVGDHLAENGVYRDIPAQLEQDREALVESLGEFFQQAAHRYELIGDVVAGDNTVAFQYRMVPLGPDQGNASVGQESLEAIRGAEFIQLAGDKALSIHDYYQLQEPPVRANEGAVASLDRKYAKSGLGKRRIKRYMEELERLMRDESLYLSSDLTLPRLAKRLGCSVNHLSQVINAGFGMSFFDWLSQYRIEHARALLRETEPQPVLSIAYAVGFNSNSAFYTAFKKWVGTTPTAYRDMPPNG